MATAQTLSEYPDFERYQKDNERIIQNKTYPKVILSEIPLPTDGLANAPFFYRSSIFRSWHQRSNQSATPAPLPKDVIDLKPKAVVINIGTNDIAENTGKYSIEYTVSNIKSMVELAKSHKIKVYLSSVLPVDVYPWRKDITDAVKQIYELNVRIRQLAKAKHVHYIDYFSEMSKENGGMIDEYTYDGVHPTDKGYEVMEKSYCLPSNSHRYKPLLWTLNIQMECKKRGGILSVILDKFMMNCILN